MPPSKESESREIRRKAHTSSFGENKQTNKKKKIALVSNVTMPLVRKETKKAETCQRRKIATEIGAVSGDCWLPLLPFF